MVTPGRTAAF